MFVPAGSGTLRIYSYHTPHIFPDVGWQNLSIISVYSLSLLGLDLCWSSVLLVCDSSYGAQRQSGELGGRSWERPAPLARQWLLMMWKRGFLLIASHSTKFSVSCNYRGPCVLVSMLWAEIICDSFRLRRLKGGLGLSSLFPTISSHVLYQVSGKMTELQPAWVHKHMCRNGVPAYLHWEGSMRRKYTLVILSHWGFVVIIYHPVINQVRSLESFQL